MMNPIFLNVEIVPIWYGDEKHYIPMYKFAERGSRRTTAHYDLTPMLEEMETNERFNAQAEKVRRRLAKMASRDDVEYRRIKDWDIKALSQKLEKGINRLYEKMDIMYDEIHNNTVDVRDINAMVRIDLNRLDYETESRLENLLDLFFTLCGECEFLEIKNPFGEIVCEWSGIVYDGVKYFDTFNDGEKKIEAKNTGVNLKRFYCFHNVPALAE